MPETLETAIETNRLTIVAHPAVIAAVAALALNGTVDFTQRTVRMGRTIRKNRKAKKALKNHEPRRSEA